MEIPIIDFASCGLGAEKPASDELDSTGCALVKAFADVGFAYVKNAGIPESKVQKVHAAMKEFSLLSHEIKSKFRLDEWYHGYVGLAGEGLNTERPGDLKETYSLVNLERPNVKFPDEYVPGFSEAWKDLYELCRQLALRVLDLLGRGLKLKVEDLDGNFIEAKPIPGTILINIADSLQFWTQGRLKSTRHRVMMPKGERRSLSRQSIAYFVQPDHEVKLTGIEYESDAIRSTKVWEVEQGKTYTSKEYIEMRLKATNY